MIYIYINRSSKMSDQCVWQQERTVDVICARIRPYVKNTLAISSFCDRYGTLFIPVSGYYMRRINLSVSFGNESTHLSFWLVHIYYLSWLKLKKIDIIKNHFFSDSLVFKNSFEYQMQATHKGSIILPWSSDVAPSTPYVCPEGQTTRLQRL